MRQYFRVGLVHSGHLAKSFGLSETPRKIAEVRPIVEKENRGKFVRSNSRRGTKIGKGECDRRGVMQ